MIRHHNWKRLSLPPGTAILICLAAGVLFSLILHDAFTHPEVTDSAIALNPISERDVPASPSSADLGTASPPVRLEIDATQTSADDPALLQDLRTGISNAVGPAASLTEVSAPPRADISPGSDWNLWARLASPRASATLLDTPPREGLRIYAVHSREGATVCLVNLTQLQIPLELRFRAPHSIYKLERLTFTPREEATSSQQPAVFSSLPAEIAARTDARLDQLQGRDLTATNTIAFPHNLKAGQICLIRLSDTAYASRIALNQVRDQLKTLKQASSELSSRLHVILDGTASFEKALTGGSHITTERRLSQIHRFLLVLGQAHSLNHNFQTARAVRSEKVDAFMDSLERLNAALADTSAALIGLVPQVGLALDETPSVNARTAGSMIPVSQTDAAPHSALMTVSLSNTGNHSARLVKIGVATAALPESVRCEPSDPALFGTLAPGQTVRAVYRLNWNGSPSLPGNRCIGDISYFMDGAPAHLRPHTW